MKEIIADINNLHIYSLGFEEKIMSLKVAGINREIMSSDQKTKDLVGLSGLENILYVLLNTNDPYFKYNDYLLIRGNEAVINKYKVNIIIKQNE